MRANEALDAVQRALSQLDPARLTIDAWQDASARTGELMADFRDAVSEVNRLLGLASGRDRILRYLRRHVGQVVTGAQLSGVAAIYEWARRLRELRVEEGWPVESGLQRSDLDVDEYVLASDAPDAALAAQWRLAKTVRGSGGSGKSRGLTYLEALSPEPADQDQLAYVMNIASWQRRIRELDEEGWEIRSNIDEPHLRPGTYRLATLRMRPPRQRKAIKIRWQILERDDFTCQDCGARRGDAGVQLQVHHLKGVRRGGTNASNNLATLCSNCHAGRHAVKPGRTADELLDPGSDPDH
jgi:hypothetical protein